MSAPLEASRLLLIGFGETEPEFGSHAGQVECLPPLFKTKAEVIERNAVGIKTFATGSKYRNRLRREVQNLPELHFLLTDLCIGALLFAQVEDEGVVRDKALTGN